MATLPKLTGIKKYQINYRHVIDTLLRKPGGFRNYRYRDNLCPTLIFRQAWDALQERLPPRKADLACLRILKLAAEGLESAVAAVLEDLLNTQAPWNEQLVAERVQPLQPSSPNLQEHSVNLSAYDQRLNQDVCGPRRATVSPAASGAGGVLCSRLRPSNSISAHCEHRTCGWCRCAYGGSDCRRNHRNGTKRKLVSGNISG